MLEHVIKSLSLNKEAAIENLKFIFESLKRMSSYSPYCYNINDSDIHEVFEYPSLLKGKWGLNVLNQRTINLLNAFNNQWVDYRKKTEYSDSAEFIYLDPKWHSIIVNHLIPALQSMENDFKSQNIDFESYKVKYSPSARPSDEDILKRASRAYHLLYTNKIIEKHYLDDDD